MRSRRLRPHDFQRAANQRGAQSECFALAQNGQFDGLVGLRLGQNVLQSRIAVDVLPIDNHDAVAGLQTRLRGGSAGADHLDRAADHDAVILHHHVSQVAGAIFKIAIPSAAQLDPGQGRSLVAQGHEHAIWIRRIGIGRSYCDPLVGDFLLRRRGSRLFLRAWFRFDRFRLGLRRRLFLFVVLLGLRRRLFLCIILLGLRRLLLFFLLHLRNLRHLRRSRMQTLHQQRVPHQNQEGEYDEPHEVRQGKCRLGTFWHS